LPSVEARYLSPLRYPGGKGRLAGFVGRLIEAQPARAATYVEPFAGGAGVGLRLLFDEYVDDVVLNDLNPGIAAFWRAVFDDTDSFLELVAEANLTVEEWYHQRDRYRSGGSDLELGFATFYLNRTNRSGILDARPIGGLEQTGKWLIDARFDKEKLARRVRVLARYASRVTICEEDGVGLVEGYLGDASSFIYADPPYLVEGDDLYLDAVSWEDHQRLAALLKSANVGWFLTYDADSRITNDLYFGLRCAVFQTSHTAATQHVGQEYAVFADSLQVPSLRGLGSGPAQFVAP
jgi:DNA adenine methylase